MNIGYTFEMLIDLTHQLKKGTLWYLFKSIPANPSVPHSKDISIFVRLNEFRIPEKIGVRNSIRLQPSSIKRYLEQEYIKEYNYGGKHG